MLRAAKASAVAYNQLIVHPAPDVLVNANICGFPVSMVLFILFQSIVAQIQQMLCHLLPVFDSHSDVHESFIIFGFVMVESTTYHFDVYQPRNPKASAYYKYLDCGDLHMGFARVRCEEYCHEYLLAFSCKRRQFCPSCHQKRVIEYGQ